MASRIITQFKNDIGDDAVFSIRAAISPLFMIVCWQESEEHPLGIMCVTKGRDTRIAANEREYIALATDKFDAYFHGRISLQELVDEYEAFERETQAVYVEVMRTDLANLSDQDLWALMAKVNKVFLDMVNITVYIENVDYEKMLGVIGEEHKAKLDAIWERATESAFLSFEGRRLKQQIEIVKAESGNAVREAKFIYTDYFWTKPEQVIEEGLVEVRKHLVEKQAEVEESEAVTKDREEAHAAWLDTLEPESRKIAEYAQLVMRMRDMRKDPIAQIQAALAELSVVFLVRAGVDAAAAPYVLVYEYLEGIEYLSRHQESIEKRSAGCVYLANADRTYDVEVYDFEQASAELLALIEHKIVPSDTLQGQIACKGKVTGLARVIIDPHDDKGFQAGDILVTSMTRPEFVPLMKLSGAVVTNEGGITCHAAIVSRELKKPCIIGTKIATQVLHDGDLVEVDADAGVVRVLEKVKG